MLLDELLLVRELCVRGDSLLDALRHDLIDVSLRHASMVFLFFLLGFLSHFRPVFHRPEALAKLVVLSDFAEIVALER